MNQEHQSVDESPVAINIRQLLKEYQSSLGEFELVRVEGGYIVRLKDRPVSPEKNWLLVDFDDTLVATSEAKKLRTSLLQKVLAESGPTLNIEEVTSLLEQAEQLYLRLNQDQFYNSELHIQVLSMILDAINPDLDDKVKLIEIFRKSYFNPEAYPVMVQVLEQLSANTVEIHEQDFNIAILTFGKPDFQLAKVLAYLKDHPKVMIAEIWLTQVEKGDFLQEVVKQKLSLGLNLNSSSDVDKPKKPNIIFIDDAPEQLASMETARSTIKENFTVATLRSLHPDTKNTKQPIIDHESTLNFANGLTVEEVVSKLSSI